MYIHVNKCLPVILINTHQHACTTFEAFFFLLQISACACTSSVVNKNCGPSPMKRKGTNLISGWILVPKCMHDIYSRHAYSYQEQLPTVDGQLNLHNDGLVK